MSLFRGMISVLICVGFGRADESLRERLGDTHAEKNDAWIYNDIRQAMAEAKSQNKPLFVTFRCVPCKACSAFDADVASGNESVQAIIKEKFVAVRQVEMKGVDLSLFQFDHDLNWAGIFINADGVVYARYGTQSSEGADAYNSIEGLLNTINRVLAIHAEYPRNVAELAGKRGEPKPITNAIELPGIRQRERYAGQTTRQTCLHCHNIHDAEHQHALDTGKYSVEMLWKYPFPENLGLKIDRTSGIRIKDVVAESAGSVAGLQPGDEIIRMNGQRITSIADMQWVLHHLPNTLTQVDVETNDTGRHTVTLKSGWKQTDFSWRASMWNAPPRFQAWAPLLDAAAQTKLGIVDPDTALEVRWINRASVGGKQAIDDGLREKDIIVAIAGDPIRMNTQQFNVYLKRHYKVGDCLPITVLRDGHSTELKIKLVE